MDVASIGTNLKTLVVVAGKYWRAIVHISKVDLAASANVLALIGMPKTWQNCLLMARHR